MKQTKLINTFWDCNVTIHFWSPVMDFLIGIDGNNIHVIPKGIIFGHVQFGSYLRIQNCIVFFQILLVYIVIWTLACINKYK
jgi:hypothetical protein